MFIKNNCIINTCFVPPGNNGTLEQIDEFVFNSGIHKKLSIDFSDEKTLTSWSDIIGEILTDSHISLINDCNSSRYQGNNILSSSTFLSNFDDIQSKLNCIDFTGKYKINCPIKFINDKADNIDFLECIRKLLDQYYVEYNKISNEFRRNVYNKNLSEFYISEIEFLVKEIRSHLWHYYIGKDNDKYNPHRKR